MGPHHVHFWFILNIKILQSFHSPSFPAFQPLGQGVNDVEKNIKTLSQGFLWEKTLKIIKPLSQSSFPEVGALHFRFLKISNSYEAVGHLDE